MEFTEKMHAWIAASFYQEMRGVSFPQCDTVFLHCVYQYGNERGTRMALRALRDGKPLDYNTYAAYREWNPTNSSIEEGSLNQSECTETVPDYVVHYSRCPWAEKFREMNEIHAAQLYCSAIDRSIIHGFNPDLRFEVKGCLACDKECVQKWLNAHVDLPFKKPDPSNQEDFTFHCGHLFWTFAHTLKDVEPDIGKAIAQKVLDRFASENGPDAAETLQKYERNTFTRL